MDMHHRILAATDRVDEQENLQHAAERGQVAWQRLGLRLRSVTPHALVRGLMVAGALLGIAWLLVSSAAALLPFWVGLILAYAMLPLVDWLDRFMPRTLAVLLLLAVELSFLALFLMFLLPTVVLEGSRFVDFLPQMDQARAVLDRLVGYLRTLPEPLQRVIRDWLTTEYTRFTTNLTGMLSQGVGLGVGVALRLLGTLSFVLGFLVIPTWIVGVLVDQKRGRRALDRLLPYGWRADVWAVARIIDRVFGVYVRGQFLLALAVGLLTGAGLLMLRRLGLPGIEYPMLFGLFAGFMNLIPIVGAIVGIVPALLIALAHSWQTALLVLGLYLVVQQVNEVFLRPRVESRSVDIHPAILAIVVVIGSQAGLLGALVAAPLAVVARDLFRYVYGRLDAPPRPAGVLPGEKLPLAPALARTSPRAALAPPRRVYPSAPVYPRDLETLSSSPE